MLPLTLFFLVLLSSLHIGTCYATDFSTTIASGVSYRGAFIHFSYDYGTSGLVLGPALSARTGCASEGGKTECLSRADLGLNMGYRWLRNHNNTAYELRVNPAVSYSSQRSTWGAVSHNRGAILKRMSNQDFFGIGAGTSLYYEKNNIKISPEIFITAEFDVGL